MKEFLGIAFSRKIVIRALKISIVIGSLLNVINQHEALFSLKLHELDISKIILTYCVPYIVSTYAGAMAVMKK